MKKVYTFFAAVLITASIFGQIPEKMSYQAVVRDNSNLLVVNQSVGMQISILQGASDGTAMYVETQTPTTNANGLISIEIGGGTPVTGTFESIDWSTGVYFIKTETDLTGGTNYTITGTSQLLSVPYAVYSKNAETYNETQTIEDVAVLGNSVNDQLKNLIDPTDSQDAATKAYVDALLSQIQALQNQPGIVKDVEGNLYTSFKIGDQIWMGENLKTTSYNDGTPIPLVSDATEWSLLTTPAYCWYSNDSVMYKNLYGALYTWYAVNSGILCPVGWHVPSNIEWTTLITYLGSAIAAPKLKEAGTLHWSSSYTGTISTNEFSFTALPAGIRRYDSGLFQYIGTGTSWWTATEQDATTGRLQSMGINFDNLTPGIFPKNQGCSVRCVKDQ